jgi:exodeoxyribonuclease VII small subunit
VSEDTSQATKQEEAQKFSELMAELKGLLSRLESDDVELDELAELLTRAAQLVQQGRSRIRETQLQVREIFAEMEDADEDEA